MQLSFSVAAAAGAALSFGIATMTFSPAARAQYYVAPAPVIVAPAPVVVVPPRVVYVHRPIWIRAHFNRFGVFVPGHWY